MHWGDLWQRQAFDLLWLILQFRVFTDRSHAPKLVLYVNNSLFTLNPNCFNLDFWDANPLIHHENVR
jgi:hypothetical protein